MKKIKRFSTLPSAYLEYLTFVSDNELKKEYEKYSKILKKINNGEDNKFSKDDIVKHIKCIICEMAIRVDKNKEKDSSEEIR